MAELERLYDPETGERFVRTPTGEIIPVTDANREAAGQSAGEAFLSTLGTTLAAPVYGIGGLLGSESMQQQFEADQAANAARAQFQPGASTLGAIGGYAPDVALGVATGGSSLLGTAARGAAVEGALGLARTQSLEGAAIQGAAGAVGGAAGPVIARGVQAGTDAARRVISGVPRAGGEAAEGGARTAADRFAMSRPDAQPNVRLNEIADELGYRLTPGVRSGSRSMRMHEAALESRPGGASAFARLRQHNEDNLVGDIVEGLGGQRGKHDLSPESRGQMKDATSGKFEKVVEGDYQVNVGGLKRGYQQERSFVEMLEDPEVKKKVKDVVKNLSDNDMGSKATYHKISRLRETAADAWNSNQDGFARAIDKIADDIEENLIAAAPKEVRQILKEAKAEWKFMRSLENGKGITTNGDLNWISLDSAMRKNYNNAYRYGGGLDTEPQDRALKSIRVAEGMKDIVGNSGTATRSANVLEFLTTYGPERAAAQTYLEGRPSRGAVAGAAAGAAATAYGGAEILN